jgi:hypothetical protein
MNASTTTTHAFSKSKQTAMNNFGFENDLL